MSKLRLFSESFKHPINKSLSEKSGKELESEYNERMKKERAIYNTVLSEYKQKKEKYIL